MKRGDVVMAVIPFLEGSGAKRRPVVIVQADTFSENLRDTTVASVTSNMSLIGPPNRLLIDPASPKGASSGLNHRSVVRCDRLFTIPQWGSAGSYVSSRPFNSPKLMPASKLRST